MACNRYSHLSYSEKPTLFFEFHGTSHSVDDQAEAVGETFVAYFTRELTSNQIERFFSRARRSRAASKAAYLSHHAVVIVVMTHEFK